MPEKSKQGSRKMAVKAKAKGPKGPKPYGGPKPYAGPVPYGRRGKQAKTGKGK